MAGAQVPISSNPASTTIVTGDLLIAVIGGTTKKITAGNFRAQLFAFAATDPLNCGILTGIGNSTITGTLSGITTLTAAAVVATTVTATTITGTLAAGVQTGITGLGTQAADLLFTDATYDIGKTGATRPRDGFFSRNVTISGTLTANQHSSVSGNSLHISAIGGGDILMEAGGVGRWSILGTGGHLVAAVDNATDIGAAGATRPRNVFVAGNVTFGGNLVFGAAAGKIIPGATSTTFANNANTQNNVVIADNGDTTIRGNIQMTAGTALLGTSGHQLISATYGAGYTNAWTGAAANTATGYDASTITLPQLAARVRAIQESLTTHGLIGV